MATDQSLWHFFANAGPIVKAVMLLLLAASILSWTVIFQRAWLLKQTRTALAQFEDRFWSGIEMHQLYSELKRRANQFDGMASIFRAGFKEFSRLEGSGLSSGQVINSVERAMRIASAKQMDKLEAHLAVLATIGSTSPYIGLFGTVWGIMTSFQALGSVQQATIAMVAPGISEALIATAMGLFAAIPAVIAYNRFASTVERIGNQYDTFSEEMSGIITRQLQLEDAGV